MNRKGIYSQLFTAAALVLTFTSSNAQSPWLNLAKRPSTLGLDKGMSSYDAGKLRLSLVNASQTVSALLPKGISDFDFTPSDSIKVRSADGLYHLGDLNLQLRWGKSTSWKKYRTAAARNPVKALKAGGNVLTAADLSPTLPADIPLNVIRYWETQNGQLVLRFVLKNTSKETVEIGGLGIPMIFNNMLEGKTLEQAHARNVFYDPYIGKDAGYLQVTRLSGHAPSLLVVPYGKTPFEAYNPLLDDPSPRGIAFEGFYEWMVYSKAYAENEWKEAEQWNTPTSGFLKAGESKSFGLRFLVAGAPNTIENELLKQQLPVAMGIPGYVLPMDVNARLFLKYKQQVKTIKVEPAAALSVVQESPAKNGWKTYSVKGKAWGRARLSITYADGLVQTVNYKVIKPEKEVIADYGKFLTTKQWFEQPDPIFKRSPSVISYDDEKKMQVTQDNRAWIAGLSDEGGAGGWLGAMMKQVVMPDRKEVEQLKRFASETLFGRIQHKDGPQKYGVKKSLFYYEPDSLPAGTYSKDIRYKTWSAWPRKEADNIGRSYNYPHVAAAHWTLYRLARNYKGLVPEIEWKEHLIRAHETAMAMVTLAPYYAQFGQMEGTVFYLILRDLKLEGMNDMASILEGAMKKRAVHWSTLEYPFGSEMPWDSTGQEEVYMWSDYFGYKEKAKVTLDAILAYMPVIPHWAYHGNARRYWDFLYGGKLSRIERMIHHYGSALNAIPVLKAYRDHPEDLYLLRTGYAGLMGGISNITQEGFAPAAFHAFPSTLKNDGLSGDYGSGFFGYAINTAAYLMENQEFGWLTFGGNLKKENGWISIQLTTAAKSAVFIAPAGLWITLDAGQIRTAAYHPATKAIRLILEPGSDISPEALLRIEQTVKTTDARTYHMKGMQPNARGAFQIPLKAKEITTISLGLN
jgi:hypothetical protein